MNGLGKPIKKTPIQKIETVKIKVKLPHVNKKLQRGSKILFKQRFFILI